MKILLLLVVLVGLVECSFAQQATYDVTAGNGNGIRFWANNAYKIHMGNSSEYIYGPVTGYSIKTNMSSDAGRGWTWGVSGATPVAALSNAGSMQIAGSFTSGETISITSGNGKGIRFWNQDEYKIHMGNSAEYLYGPVTDYSIKMNMSSHAGRGWTWGVSGATPIAAINTSGTMQLAGGLKANGIDSKGILLSRYGNALSGDVNPYTISSYDNESHDLTVYGSSAATLHLRLYDGDLKLGSNATPNTILYNNGAASFGGTVGIGITGTYGSSTLHAKSKTTSPWAVISEAQTNRGIIGLNHNGNAGVIAVSYLDESGFKPLQLWTQNAARMTVAVDGNVGIGTTAPNEKLTVNGTIYGKEVKVDLNVPAPDYVFEKDYNLPSLEEIQGYIDQHKHLPEVPSAKEIEIKGINVGEMNMILLKKVEELTLYLLEQNNKLIEQNEIILKQNDRITKLENTTDK